MVLGKAYSQIYLLPGIYQQCNISAKISSGEPMETQTGTPL